MVFLFPAYPGVPDDLAGSDAAESHLLSGRVLARLIAFSFTSAHGVVYSFRDTFHAFAEAYFTLALEDDAVFRWPAFCGQSVDALERVFSNAVEAGALEPPSASPRLTAVTVLTSLAALQGPVIAGALLPAEAADLLVVMLFEGLQAASPSSF